jgi:hypothetical protein
MASKDDIIADLRGLVEKLTKRIEELELQLAKAQKDSSNSLKMALERYRQATQEEGGSPQESQAWWTEMASQDTS